MFNSTLVLGEPNLLFGFDQVSPDPKEGLFLFGPPRHKGNPTRLRIGVVGTHASLELYRSWVSRLQRAVLSEETPTSVFFPGFQELFSCEWSPDPDLFVAVDPKKIEEALFLSDRHLAVYETVGIYCAAIQRAQREEEQSASLWFVIVPDEIYRLARPRSVVPLSLRRGTDVQMTARLARRLLTEPSLFESDMENAEPYFFDLDFRNQLKARLIECRAVTQIVRESTLADPGDTGTRRLQDPATIAWNLATSSFYKCEGRPWRLANTREGVCYVGLVFKKDATGPSDANSCCGAQMFLTDGEGMVFKGRLGPWHSEKNHEFHLSYDAARSISEGVVASFKEKTGRAPSEIFYHGKTRFNNTEWRGFGDGVPSETNVVGVRIIRTDELKLFRPGRLPVLRGTAVLESARAGYLWSSGYIPALATYPGWETPNPLRIEITHGSAEIQTVLEDILNLTKLNFNACLYSDGLPVTLRFADSVGEILTAAPNLPDEAPLPFKHYI